MKAYAVACCLLLVSLAPLHGAEQELPDDPKLLKDMVRKLELSLRTQEAENTSLKQNNANLTQENVRLKHENDQLRQKNSHAAQEVHNDNAGKQSVVVDPKGLKVGGTYRLPRGVPLMPELNPSDPLAAMRKMVPPGGSIAVISLSEKRGVPWYEVDAYNAANDMIGRGWVNSAALLGQRLDRVVKEAVPVPNREDQETLAKTEPSTANGIPQSGGTDQEKATSAMDERIRKAYRADPDKPILSTLSFEHRSVTSIGNGSYEMVVICSIVYPDRPTQRDRTRWHMRATCGPNGWQAELASLPEEP